MTIKVKNWSMFQHYKNRRPPWIRLYRDLLDDPEFHALTGDQVKSLVLLWLVASDDEKREGRLPSIYKMAFRLRVAQEEMCNIIRGLKHWVQFKDSDLLPGCRQDASNMPAHDSQHAIPESEGKGDTEGEGDITNSSLRSEFNQQATLNINGNTGESLSATNVSNLADNTSRLPKKASKPKSKAKGTPTWEAYSDSYRQKYGTAPVRNEKTNSICVQLVERLGAEEAPLVAAFYPHTRNSYHVARGHSLQCLLGDAEKIRTEWATGNQITQTQAKQEDRLQNTGDAARRVIAKFEQEGGN